MYLKAVIDYDVDRWTDGNRRWTWNFDKYAMLRNRKANKTQKLN